MVVASYGDDVTVWQLVEEVRRRLMGGLGDNINLLAADISESDTSFELQDEMHGIGRGTLLEVDIEEMYVRSVNGQQVTVLRGHNRTDPVPHEEDAFARVAPSYTTRDLFESVVHEIDALAGLGLYDFETVETTYDGRSATVELDVDPSRSVAFVYKAWRRQSANDRLRPVSVKLMRNVDAPSGYSLQVLSAIEATDLRVTVAQHFGTPTDISNSLLSEDGVGIPRHVLPVIAAGAVWRLLLAKESRRLNPDSSHGSRRAEEVPAGAIGQLVRQARQDYENVAQRALEAQFAQYPPQATHGAPQGSGAKRSQRIGG